MELLCWQYRIFGVLLTQEVMDSLFTKWHFKQFDHGVYYIRVVPEFLPPKHTSNTLITVCVREWYQSFFHVIYYSYHWLPFQR